MCSPSSTEGSTGLLVGERGEPVLALLPVGEGGREERREGGREGEERKREGKIWILDVFHTHTHTLTHTHTTHTHTHLKL